MADPFRSARLIYRAVEPNPDEDFFLNLQQDSIAYVNSNTALAKPQARKNAVEYIKRVEEALLGVVICLSTPTNTPTPIGCIVLSKSPERAAHHRYTEISIDIVKSYRGQGYGSEAIEWILEWAFEMAGMHRVALYAMSYNEGAMRLYERLGFRREGTGREMYYCRGQWWDDVQFGMLELEWRAKRDEKRNEK